MDTTYSRGTRHLGLEAEMPAEKSKKEDQGPHQCTGAFDTALFVHYCRLHTSQKYVFSQSWPERMVYAR